MTNRVLGLMTALILSLSGLALANDDGFTVGGVGEFGGEAVSPYDENGWSSLDSYRQARDCCGYQNSPTDAQLWSDANQADSGSVDQIENANCPQATYNQLRATCGAGQTCTAQSRSTFLPMRDYNLANACISPRYDNFDEYQAANNRGFGLNAADVALYEELDETTWDGFCPNDDCSTATKTQFLAAKDEYQQAQNTIQTALGDEAAAAKFTAPLLAGSSIVTNFSSFETECSVAPTEATISANLDRIKYFFGKSSAENSEENAAKQLCYATAAHTDLAWHSKMLSSFIIAADNSVTSAPDFKGCSWWKDKAAITGANTQAMKTAQNTIAYDVVNQPSDLSFGEPTLSEDQGHAILNYTLNGQGTVSGASAKLRSYASNEDGFVVASTPVKTLTVNAVEKIQTTDKLYKVYQRTASSSVSTLRNAINSPGGACPSGYSIVSSTNNNTLTTLRNVALSHGTGTAMPAGHRMEACSGNFAACNAGYQVCSNPSGANWNMRFMIYGEKGGQTCGVTRKRKSGGWDADNSNFPSSFTMYPAGGQCKDAGYSSGNPRISNGCTGWCWVRVLCRKNGENHIVWP